MSQGYLTLAKTTELEKSGAKPLARTLRIWLCVF